MGFPCNRSALDTSLWLLHLPESQFPHLSSGLRGERCCLVTTGYTVSGVRATSVVHPAQVPQSARELRPLVPPGLPVTREAPTGQVSYLYRPSRLPTAIILLLLAQSRPCCGFRRTVIYSQWKLGPLQMVPSYPPASVSLHPKGRPPRNFYGPSK